MGPLSEALLSLRPTNQPPNSAFEPADFVPRPCLMGPTLRTLRMARSCRQEGAPLSSQSTPIPCHHRLAVLRNPRFLFWELQTNTALLIIVQHLAWPVTPPAPTPGAPIRSAGVNLALPPPSFGSDCAIESAARFNQVPFNQVRCTSKIPEVHLYW